MPSTYKGRAADISPNICAAAVVSSASDITHVITVSSLSLCCSTVLILSHLALLSPFVSFPHPTPEVEGSEGAAVWCLVAG